MGLDSLDLVVSIEERFNIEIQEDEACRIKTVGELLLCIKSKLSLSDHENPEHIRIKHHIKDYFSGLHLSQIDHSSPLDKQITSPEKQGLLTYLKTKTRLDIPDLNKKRTLFSYRSNRRLKKLSLNDIITWIMALNSKTLIPEKNTYSAFEVMWILYGFFIHNLGVPFQEIKLQANLANDLGID